MVKYKDKKLEALVEIARNTEAIKRYLARIAKSLEEDGHTSAAATVNLETD